MLLGFNYSNLIYIEQNYTKEKTSLPSRNLMENNLKTNKNTIIVLQSYNCYMMQKQHLNVQISVQVIYFYYYQDPKEQDLVLQNTPDAWPPQKYDPRNLKRVSYLWKFDTNTSVNTYPIMDIILVGYFIIYTQGTASNII